MNYIIKLNKETETSMIKVTNRKESCKIPFSSNLIKKKKNVKLICK